MPKYSKGASKFIGRKMRKLHKEGERPKDQQVAIALSMARKKFGGDSVPFKKKKKGGHYAR